MNLEAPPFTDKQRYQTLTARLHCAEAGTGNRDVYWEPYWPPPRKGDRGVRGETVPRFQ